MTFSSPVTVLIPAYQEAERIAQTVAAARALPGVTRVLVVDDGSGDETADRAEAAGAEVIRLPINGGKGAALRAGLAACPGEAEDMLLLLDADLGSTAAQAADLLQPVFANDADLTIAQFPATVGKAGFGLVKGLARWGTWVLTRRWLLSPISGQRACRRWVLEAAPIADGYGVEVAMNVAAGDAGARVLEVPVAMTHAATGRDWAGVTHRGRQFVHVFSALTAAAFGRTGRPCVGSLSPTRVALWALAAGIAGFYALVAAAFWHDDAAVSLNATSPLQWVLPGILLAVMLGPLLTAKLSGLLGARRRNYRSRYIPALGGLFVLPVSIYILLALLPGHRPVIPGEEIRRLVGFPSVLLCWMALGLIDDLWGRAQRKGFHGHLNAIRHGQFTTGGVKLIGGSLLALLMAIWLLPPGTDWPQRIASALLIALLANLINLLDLRPGRALKGFWLLSLPVFVLLRHMDHGIVGVLFFLLLLATLVYAPFDFAGMMMLGDTGANPLGAFIGLCLALVLPLWGQGVVILLLIAIHLYAERASITALIERTPLLQWLDTLGRSA